MSERRLRVEVLVVLSRQVFVCFLGHASDKEARVGGFKAES